MDWWTPLLAGLVIGWFIELMLDYFYWRSKRICTGAETKLQAALDEAEVSQVKLRDQVETLTASETSLRSTLVTMEASNTTLQSEIETLTASEASLRSTLTAMETTNTTLRSEVETLTASALRISELETQLESKEASLADFQLHLREREAELIRLRGQERAFREQEKKVTDVEALLQRQEGEIEQLTVELTELMGRNAHLADLDSRLHSKETEVESLKWMLQNFTQRPEPATNGWGDTAVNRREASPVVPGRPALEADRDQLQLIWGIDARTAQVLHAHEIETFKKLAAVGTARLRDIVQMSGLQTNLSDLVFWSMQARLAAAGAWDEFAALKNELRMNAGKRVDDLQIIRGIGSTIQAILQAQGIETFAQLAETQVPQLDAILRESGVDCGLSSYDVHKSWTEQARLAANSEWELLTTFQTQIDWWEKLESFPLQTTEPRPQPSQVGEQ